MHATRKRDAADADPRIGTDAKRHHNECPIMVIMLSWRIAPQVRPHFLRQPISVRLVNTPLVGARLSDFTIVGHFLTV